MHGGNVFFLESIRGVQGLFFIWVTGVMLLWDDLALALHDAAFGLLFYDVQIEMFKIPTARFSM